jgi:hypothetical protein
MTEPGSFTDEQLDDFSNSPLNLSPNTTSETVLNTITPEMNTRTLFKLNLTNEELTLFNLDRKQIKDEITSGAILNEEAIQRLEEYDKDMFALYTRMHPGGGRRTKCRRNKKRSRSHSRRHKKRRSTKRKRRS